MSQDNRDVNWQPCHGGSIRIHPLGSRVCLVLALSVMLVPAAVDKAEASLPLSDKTSTADHTQFKALQGPFSSGPEVTQACLRCHTEAAKQLQQSLHWT